MSKPAASSGRPAPLLLLACALACAGCAGAGGRGPELLRIMKETRHANGLVVGVPEGFEARQTEDGFVVEPSGGKNFNVRYPVIGYVSLGGGAPEESDLKTKSVGGREVRYGVAKSEGGSGGPAYTLSVYERAPGGRLIRYVQAMQSEAGEPDFQLCWTLVNSTRYVEPKNN